VRPASRLHVTGNLNVGNGRAVMIDAITAVLPWIGYPRTLNALRAIDAGTAPTVD
jgi:4-carboxymuconolactone decarboxylase